MVRMSPEHSKSLPANQQEALNEKQAGKSNQGQGVHSISPEKQLPVSNANGPDETKLVERTVISKTGEDVVNVRADTPPRSVNNPLEKTVADGQSTFDEVLILSDMEMGFNADEIIAREGVNFYGAMPEVNVKEKIQTLKKDFKHWENSEVGSVERQEAQKQFKEAYEKIVPGTLGFVLVEQLKQKNIPLDNVSEEVFKKELGVLLQDMQSRGVGISSKFNKIQVPSGIIGKKGSKNDRAEYNAMLHIKLYKEKFSDLAELDAQFEKYLKSGRCNEWDTEKPLYRGGHASLERKMPRNLLKEKPAFRRDLINRGVMAGGYGQYYAADIDSAVMYGQGSTAAVISTVYLKPGVKIVDLEDVANYFGADKAQRERWDQYLSAFVKQPILYYESDEDEQLAFALSLGTVIDNVKIESWGNYSKDKRVLKQTAELSIHRLNDNKRIIGNPDTFEEVKVSDEAMLEPTDFKANGHMENESLPVMKYQQDGKIIYVVQAPEKQNTFWQVKQTPESVTMGETRKFSDEDRRPGCIPEFIIEPTQNFLLKRKQEKLVLLNSPENRAKLAIKAEENRGIIRSCFEVARALSLENQEE